MQPQILIVDDERFIVEEISEILTDEGYSCFTAESVADARTALEKNPDIGVVLCDIKMPSEDGFDLIAYTEQSLDRNIEVILMSGHGSIQLVNTARDDLKYQFLHKPVHVEELLYVINKAVAVIEMAAEKPGRRVQ